MTSALRASWPRLVHGSRLRAIYALDATAQEVLFVIGPMLGALMVSFASPRAGLLACAVDRGRADLVVRPQAAAAGAPHDESGRGRPTVRQLLLHRHRWRC